MLFKAPGYIILSIIKLQTVHVQCTLYIITIYSFRNSLDVFFNRKKKIEPSHHIIRKLIDIMPLYYKIIRNTFTNNFFFQTTQLLWLVTTLKNDGIDSMS